MQELKTLAPFGREIASINQNRIGRIFANMSVSLSIAILLMIIGMLLSGLLIVMVILVCLLLLLFCTIFTLGIVWVEENGRRFMKFLMRTISSIGDFDMERLMVVVTYATPIMASVSVFLGALGLIFMAVSKKRCKGKIILTSILIGTSVICGVFAIFVITQGGLPQ